MSVTRKKKIAKRSEAVKVHMQSYHQWTDEERDYAYLALIEAQNNVENAIEILKREAKTNPLVFVPTVASLRKLRQMNYQNYMESIVNETCLTKALELINSSDERVSADMTKYIWNRTHGQPTQMVKGEIAISLSQIEANLRKSNIPASGVWENEDADEIETITTD